MNTTDVARAKSDKKLLQLTELKSESFAVQTQYDSFWRSL